jgi:hypothetical protein
MSEAGFRERRLRDMQMLFAKPQRRPALGGGYGRLGAAASST